MNLKKLLRVAARADRLGVAVTRIGLIVVLLWIGGLKAFRYEADGIVPFVAHWCEFRLRQALTRCTSRLES